MARFRPLSPRDSKAILNANNIKLQKVPDFWWELCERGLTLVSFQQDFVGDVGHWRLKPKPEGLRIAKLSVAR